MPGKIAAAIGFILFLGFGGSGSADSRIWGWLGLLILMAGSAVAAFARPDPILRKRWWWLGPLVLGILGAGAFSWGALTIAEGNASLKWPQTTGTIVSSKIHTHYGKRGTYYKADIDYRYSVDGRFFHGSRVTTSDGSSQFKRGAQEMVDRYAVGKSVSVFYDGSRPSRSVLEPGIHATSYQMLGFGVVFLWFCYLFFMVKRTGKGFSTPR